MPLLLEHRPNEYVRSKMESLVAPREPILATVKRWKLMWFGHVTRQTIKLGTIDCLRR